MSPNAAVLYSQNDNDAGVGIISQDFTDVDFDIYDAEATDDFTVPGGSRWILTGITATGLYFNGFGPADYEKVVIYADAGGRRSTPGSGRRTTSPDRCIGPSGEGPDFMFAVYGRTK